DDHLLSLGRRTAMERAAYLIAFLHQRAAAVGLDGSKQLHIPISQLHVADTLGLSIVHTNKTLRKLADRKLIRWHDRACEVLDVDGLMEIAEWDGLPERKRPLI
ncbi:MAG: Crp/Fnr family transcriptional regulator, partial [Devosia sp.]|nr:Crp/Fnr family transcriptional regulator [Devosia sp.]